MYRDEHIRLSDKFFSRSLCFHSSVDNAIPVTSATLSPAHLLSSVSHCQSFPVPQTLIPIFSACAKSFSKLDFTWSNSSFSNTITSLHTAPGLHFRGEEKTQYVHDFFYHYQDNVSPRNTGLKNNSFHQVLLNSMVR